MSDSAKLMKGSPLKIGGIHGTGLAFLVAEICLGRDLTPYLREVIGNESSGPPTSFVQRQRSDRERPGRPRSVVVVTANPRQGEELIADAEFFLRESKTSIRRFFPWEVLPFDALSPPREASAERISALDAISTRQPGLTVVPVQALFQKLFSPAVLEKNVLSLHVNQEIDRDHLLARLKGYQRTSLVEEIGQIAVRGSVVDLWSSGSESPIRVEFFGEQIDALRFFDPQTQRSLSSTDEVRFLPVSELFYEPERAMVNVKQRARELEIPDRIVAPYIEALQAGELYPGLEHLQPLLLPELATFWDYVPADTEVVVLDEHAVETAADDFESVIEEQASRAIENGILHPRRSSGYWSVGEIQEQLLQRSSYYFNALELFGEGDFEEEPQQRVKLDVAEPADLLHELQRARQHAKDEQPLERFIARLRDYLKIGFRVGFVVSQQSRFRRFHELFSAYRLSAAEFESGFQDWRRDASASTVALIPGAIRRGFRVSSEAILLFAETDLFPDAVTRRAVKSAKQVRNLLSTLAQLKEGDFIVHVDHGIGRYHGLKQMTIDGHVADFIQLEYAEEAKLFLPVENIGKIQKYIATEGFAPELHRLGTKHWEKAKEKVRSTVTQLAGQLINIYATRAIAKGFSFGVIDDDDERFADTFPYTETPDQAQAIEAVLHDMSSDRPMDRLVCGDVGYGKTEVAIRAAFKAVNAGKQVALLVPTTILADQHYANFRERFSGYPFQVGCVSRFFTAQENKETLEKLAQGKIDIIVGTHRLFSRDVFFADLGLLIIDEEHRFGVAHKEKLKRLREQIDVLTLTATPIPRTLHMSLLGIRDMSVIETPPSDRHAIRTFIAPYNDGVVREAIMRELGRSGQVFYIHNRVQNIAGITDELKQLVPEARIEFAHGQMPETQLEEVMHRFMTHQIDVLVSTTIVESGLDITNANTMIIRKADAFGLAELYQLRGRVGRGSRRAYAYLMIADPKTLGPDAKKRLAVLQSLDDLGMGFRLALQDMEIRGAGNLLGKDQTGQVELVGYDLYSKILEEAVRELKSQAEGKVSSGPIVPIVDPEMNIGFSAHIPQFYIPDVGERLMIYQRLVELRDKAHATEFADELQDRFGRPPPEVEELLELMTFRALLKRGGFMTAGYRGQNLSLAFHPKVRLDPERVVRIMETTRGRVRLTPDRVLRIAIEPSTIRSPRDFSDLLGSVLAQLGL